MAISNSGYGAIPPHFGYGAVGAQGASGQILTTNGSNGSSWMQQGMTINTTQSAFEIRNDQSLIAFNTDGTIGTKAGTITVEDWITVIQLMKRLIMDMSKDPETVSKYPYIQDAAHSWFMKELKGNNNVQNEND